MLNFMRSVELHVIETDADVESATIAGLADVGELDDVECAACYEDVGHVNGVFYAYALILDELEQWIVCTGCAAPVLEADTSTESVTDLFAADEEFDAFELTDEED
jgi:hypothetical protein